MVQTEDIPNEILDNIVFFVEDQVHKRRFHPHPKLANPVYTHIDLLPLALTSKRFNDIVRRHRFFFLDSNANREPDNEGVQFQTMLSQWRTILEDPRNANVQTIHLAVLQSHYINTAIQAAKIWDLIVPRINALRHLCLTNFSTERYYSAHYFQECHRRGITNLMLTDLDILEVQNGQYDGPKAIIYFPVLRRVSLSGSSGFLAIAKPNFPNVKEVKFYIKDQNENVSMLSFLRNCPSLLALRLNATQCRPTFHPPLNINRVRATLFYTHGLYGYDTVTSDESGTTSRGRIDLRKWKCVTIQIWHSRTVALLVQSWMLQPTFPEIFMY